eukprot:4641987-Pyramimonas_sp.AAC.1
MAKFQGVLAGGGLDFGLANELRRFRDLLTVQLTDRRSAVVKQYYTPSPRSMVSDWLPLVGWFLIGSRSGHVPPLLIR